MKNQLWKYIKILFLLLILINRSWNLTKVVFVACKERLKTFSFVNMLYAIFAFAIQKEETIAFDDQYQLDICFFCCKNTLIIVLKSLTIELRVLNVDDDDTRNVIIIDVLNKSQSILKNVWKIQNSFDVTYKISVNKHLVRSLKHD